MEHNLFMEKYVLVYIESTHTQEEETIQGNWSLGVILEPAYHSPLPNLGIHYFT